MARVKDKVYGYLPCVCGCNSWFPVYIDDGFYIDSDDSIFQCSYCGRICYRDEFIKNGNRRLKEVIYL